MRFHDLRHTLITKLAECQASEHLMAIAGHVSRKMIEHHSHVLRQSGRPLDAIVKPDSKPEGAKNWAQSSNEEKTIVRN
jgi:hypothetical protein